MKRVSTVGFRVFAVGSILTGLGFFGTIASALIFSSPYRVDFAGPGGTPSSCDTILYLDNHTGERLICTEVGELFPDPNENAAAFSKSEEKEVVDLATSLGADGQLTAAERARVEALVDSIADRHGRGDDGLRPAVGVFRYALIIGFPLAGVGFIVWVIGSIVGIFLDPY